MYWPPSTRNTLPVIHSPSLEARKATMRPMSSGWPMRPSALLASAGAILWLLPILPLAFLVGLSALVPAVLWHGLETARLPREGLE